MSTKKPKKYKIINGVMKLNPEYTMWLASESDAPPLIQTQKIPETEEPLAVISSIGDIASATEQLEEIGSTFRLSDSTAATMEIIQDEEFLEEFKQPDGNLHGSDLLDGLTEYFLRFEVPMGLINKLMMLQAYHLRLIVDDSASMRCKTDVSMEEASEYVLRGKPRNFLQMTRWQEAESRIHDMIDILAFIPIKSMEVRFLNARDVVKLIRAGKTIDEFSSEAHNKVSKSFAGVDLRLNTPTLRVLTESFQAANALPDPCIHYLFTDGVPSDCIVHQVMDLIKYRSAPEDNPVTLISCTNDDEEVEWMKQVEEIAPYCAEIDDYRDEKREVLNDQGVGLPYTRGYWLICQLVAAINPDDLDAIDENLPFTKNTLDNLLGRVHTPQEYQYYFERNPHAHLYIDLYSRFLSESIFAREIVSRDEQDARETRAGYVNGSRMEYPPDLKTISPILTEITNAAVTVADTVVPANKKVVQTNAFPVGPPALS